MLTFVHLYSCYVPATINAVTYREGGHLDLRIIMTIFKIFNDYCLRGEAYVIGTQLVYFHSD